MHPLVTDALIVGIVAAVATIITKLLDRTGQKEEVTATRTNDLIEQQGKQIDRLTAQQGDMQERMDKMERDQRETKLMLWDERDHNRKLRRGLSDAVGDLTVAWAWIDLNPAPGVPRRPNLGRYESLLEPRPRRPPPGDETDV